MTLDERAIMAATQAGIVLRHLRGLTAVATGQADRQLLDCFVSQSKHDAFEALVRRHGAMVLAVCRRVLGNRHDAEDAFQSTFLVLARKARTIARRESVGGWLYQVAYHTALKAKASARARQRRERQAGESRLSAFGFRTPDPLAEVTGRELLTVLDEEMHRLPERYRTPLVLCYLEGRTRDEAARQLGETLATLKRRLERGRERLRARLERRGVALPAALPAVGLTSAAVPSALATTTGHMIRLALSGHAAALPPAVARLAAASVPTMIVGKWRFVAAAVLFTSLLGGGWLAHRTPADEPNTARPAQKKQVESPAPDEKQPMVVSGRAVGPDGKPAGAAQIAVVARQGVLINSWEGWTRLRNDILGRTRTDPEGRFRLVVPRTDPLMTTRHIRVVAFGEKAGMAWKAVDPNTAGAKVQLRLTPVQPVRGRILGIQGEPAAGVPIHVARITRKPEKDEREDDAALRPPAGLHVTATTDANGEFAFTGFGPGLKLELEIRDPRYQRKDEWFVETADAKQCENLRLVLPPGQVVEGRILYQDTRQPVPHARITIANPVVDAQADAEGRFRVSLFPATEIGIRAFPPAGAPYLPGWKDVGFPKGVVHREVDVLLPRAVLVRGTITEAGSGKPVAGAYVQYNGDWRNGDTVSGPDGAYALGVPAGAGRLLVSHPSGEYIPGIVLGSAGGNLDKPTGDPLYYHGMAEVDVKAGNKIKEANIELRRGVTVAGRLCGPDDRPVASALLFVSSHKPRSEKTMHPIYVRDGQFEVRGCDPDKSYQLLFLEYPQAPRPLMMAESLQTFGQLWMADLVNRKDSRGASVQLSAQKAVGEPLVVRVAPCGSARLRFLDAAGKPKADFVPWLQLVVTPGPPVWKAIEDKVLAAEVVTLAGAYGDQPPGQPKTDAEGYVTYTGLIPGATYRVKTYSNDMSRNMVLKDFTVEAGKTTELDIIMK